MNSCGSDSAPMTRRMATTSISGRTPSVSPCRLIPATRRRAAADSGRIVKYTAGMDPGVGSVILLGVVAVIGIGSLLLVRHSRQLRSSGTAPRGSDNASSETPPTG